MAIALVEARANLGDADLPGGPVEQLNAEAILERFDSRLAAAAKPPLSTT
jgi:hypothetical protein